LLAVLPQPVPGGVIVDPGFRSEREDRWREIHSRTGRGDLDAFIQDDPGFVTEEAARFADALRRVAARIGDGQRALVVGHSPMLEAAVWATTGRIVPPLGKGEGVVLLHEGGSFEIAG
jgi:phosphohistidine phosphatase SixA